MIANFHTSHCFQVPAANSAEQWPEGLGIEAAAAEDAREDEAGWRAGQIALVAVVIGLSAAFLIPQKIIVLVAGTAWVGGLIAAVVLAWRPRFPSLRWNTSWTGPAVLIGLIALATGFLIALYAFNAAEML